MNLLPREKTLLFKSRPISKELGMQKANSSLHCKIHRNMYIPVPYFFLYLLNSVFYCKYDVEKSSCKIIGIAHVSVVWRGLSKAY